MSPTSSCRRAGRATRSSWTTSPPKKVAGVRRLIDAAGARLLYLPPHSPDLNPIENASARLEALLRTAAVRTAPAVWAAIRDASTRFKPDECENCLAAAAYDAHDPD